MVTSITDEHAVKRHHALTSLIQQETDRRAFISFARFMELALYAPGLGFYEHRGKAIGPAGDYFTSVSVGPLLGELLACQFARWLGNLACPQPVIVEAGAHDGRLALDLFTSLQRNEPQLTRQLEYWLIEPSPVRQGWQRETLKRFLPQLRWFQSWTDLSSFCERKGHGLTAVIFANELLDALPVHRLRWRKADRIWQELLVRTAGEGFTWDSGSPGTEVVAYGKQIASLNIDPTACPIWPCLPDALLEALPDAFTIEICPEALRWWQQAANALTQGWLVTLDYGLSALECFAPHRQEGTVRGYHAHRVTSDLLARPGQQDLTAHVNFSAVQLVGEAIGMRTELHGSQAKLLTDIVQSSWPVTTRPFTPSQARQFQTLTHPQHLGRPFRALVQSKGIPAES